MVEGLGLADDGKRDISQELVDVVDDVGYQAVIVRYASRLARVALALTNEPASPRGA
jgi:hypothetical protein